MKKTLIVGLLAFAWVTGAAQSSGPKKVSGRYKPANAGDTIAQLMLAGGASKVKSNYIDSLQQLIDSGKDDTLQVRRLLDLGFYYLYVFSKPDSALAYTKRALRMSLDINYPLGEAVSDDILGRILIQLGDYVGALKAGYKALDLCQRLNDSSAIALALFCIGENYRDQGDYGEALIYEFRCVTLLHALPDNGKVHLGSSNWSKNQFFGVVYDGISICYLRTNPDSALFYALISHNADGPWSLLVLGSAYAAKGQNDSALYYFRRGLRFSNPANKDVADNYVSLAKVFQLIQLDDSSIYYAKKGLELSESIPYEPGIYRASGLLADLYETIDPLKSIEYHKLNRITNDSLFNQQKT